MDPNIDKTNTSNQTANMTESSSEHLRLPEQLTETHSPSTTEATAKKQRAKKLRNPKDHSKSPPKSPSKSRSKSVRETRTTLSDEVISPHIKRRSSLSNCLTDQITEDLESQSASHEKIASSNISVDRKSTVGAVFDYDSLDGDFLKMTVKKSSESKSGICLEKMDGRFILVGLPPHEQRRVLGLKILAINGQSTFHTVSKAMDIISRTEDEVRLVLDFSSPWDAPVAPLPIGSNESRMLHPPLPLATSPLPSAASGSSFTGTAALSNSSGRKIAYRKVDRQSNGDGTEEIMSVAQSERTFKVTNRAPRGSTRAASQEATQVSRG